jgi:hypothetical protein
VVKSILLFSKVSLYTLEIIFQCQLMSTESDKDENTMLPSYYSSPRNPANESAARPIIGKLLKDRKTEEDIRVEMMEIDTQLPSAGDESNIYQTLLPPHFEASVSRDDRRRRGSYSSDGSIIFNTYGEKDDSSDEDSLHMHADATSFVQKLDPAELKRMGFPVDHNL